MEAPLYEPALRIAERFGRNGTPGDVATPNERAVLRRIWDSPGLSRAELIGGFDITQQSLHRIVEHLLERGLVRLGPPKHGAGRGQPSPTLFLEPSWGLTAGISINTDRAGITVMDLAGDRQTRSINIAGMGRMASIDRIESVLDTLIGERGRGRDDLFGIGFGISGFRVGGTRFNPPEPLADWALVELGPLLADRFDAPVWVDNGANLAAIAEATLGVGRIARDFAYLSFNYGFGGAVFVDGRLLIGAMGNAGEFSGIYNEGDFFDRPALGLLLKALAEQGIEVATIAELKQKFDPEWPGVTAWVDKAAPPLNRLLNALGAITDPSYIVFGGELPLALANMMIARAEFWGRPRFGVSRALPELIISEIRDEPSAIGGASLPLMKCLF